VLPSVAFHWKISLAAREATTYGGGVLHDDGVHRGVHARGACRVHACAPHGASHAHGASRAHNASRAHGVCAPRGASHAHACDDDPSYQILCEGLREPVFVY